MVSVIIPNYNHAKFLDKRIQSVLNQTYQDFELIILDDCSTDNSREIIEKYRLNKKVSMIIYNEANSGSTFKQWKKGIDLANGEYIWIAESDDYADNLFLEKTTALMDKYKPVVVFTDSVIVDENDIMLPDSWTNDSLKNSALHIYFDGNNFIKHYLLKGNVIYNASAVLFRNKDFLNIQDITKFRFCGDWCFWGDIIINYSVVFCNEKLNFLRVHTQKTSNKASKIGLDYLEGLDVVAGLKKRVNISTVENFLLGKYYLKKIKRDTLIENEIIRKQCIKKSIALFPVNAVLLFVYPVSSFAEVICNKIIFFLSRIRNFGFISTLRYYFSKYSLVKRKSRKEI